MNFLKDPRTNWKYIFIILILAIVVGGGILWFSVKQEPSYQPPEIEKPEKVVEDETANWKIYRNKDYGFEVKYPEDYLVKEEKIAHGLEEEQPLEYILSYRYEKPVWLLNTVRIYSSLTEFPPKGAEIEINIFNNANNLTVKQWLDYINKGVEQGLIYEGRAVVDREPVSVVGIESIKGVYGCCGKCVEGIFISKGDKIYNLGIEGVAGFFPDYVGYYGYSEKDECYFGDKSIFNQMLSTFRFLE